MPKKKTRVARNRRPATRHERSTFPVLLVLVMGLVILGMFNYLAVLVAGSIIFAGFFGWLWWTRRAAAAPKTKKIIPARRKPRKR
jgi:hypothetical protein